MDDGTFFFSKGTAKHFRHPNLSGGEKAAFDLILDFVLGTEVFKDAVYCLDEPELHLGSRVQARLLKAFMANLPENCQLWVATHSVGMMREALRLSQGGSTVQFLDTSDLDFDTTVVMEPVIPDRIFWKRILEIALDDMAALVAPEKVFLCEGSDAASGFDAVCYRSIFQAAHPEAEFVSVGGSKAVRKGGVGIADAIGVVAEGTKVLKVIDGDDHTTQERIDAKPNGVLILDRRSIETYLLSDEILQKLCDSAGMPARCADVIAARTTAIAAAGAPVDDFKKARQAVHHFARNDLNISHVGSTADVFLGGIVAPLVTPDTATYKDLHSVLFE